MGFKDGFEEFPKIARLSRACVITEKIDGTNAQIHIISEFEMHAHTVMNGPELRQRAARVLLQDGTPVFLLAGSRSRYVFPNDDNFCFAIWAYLHREELAQLGVGRHFGEWWGCGIQRGYGLTNGEKRFSLFNTGRWGAQAELERGVARPACCGVVPILYEGIFSTDAAGEALDALEVTGSLAAPGFMKPEGIVIYHEAARQLFKKTIDKDAEFKGAR